MTLVVANGKYYRPAGFRSPEPGEHYLAIDGAVKVATGELDLRPRTVLREIIEFRVDEKRPSEIL